MSAPSVPWQRVDPVNLNNFAKPVAGRRNGARNIETVTIENAVFVPSTCWIIGTRSRRWFALSHDLDLL